MWLNVGAKRDIFQQSYKKCYFSSYFIQNFKKNRAFLENSTSKKVLENTKKSTKLLEKLQIYQIFQKIAIAFSNSVSQRLTCATTKTNAHEKTSVTTVKRVSTSTAVTNARKIQKPVNLDQKLPLIITTTARVNNKQNLERIQK